MPGRGRVTRRRGLPDHSGRLPRPPAWHGPGALCKGPMRRECFSPCDRRLGNSWAAGLSNEQCVVEQDGGAGACVRPATGVGPWLAMALFDGPRGLDRRPALGRRLVALARWTRLGCASCHGAVPEHVRQWGRPDSGWGCPRCMDGMAWKARGCTAGVGHGDGGIHRRSVRHGAPIGHRKGATVGPRPAGLARAPRGWTLGLRPSCLCLVSVGAHLVGGRVWELPVPAPTSFRDAGARLRCRRCLVAG